MHFIFRLLITMLVLNTSVWAKYDLAICTIFQNDAPYLKEWIEFHKLQGVQHFYLYNNLSQDDYYSVLEPYIKNEEVTLIQWPYSYDYQDHDHWIKIQSGSYIHCIKEFGEETTWLAVIDTDEFLHCVNGDKLTHFLKDYLEFGGLCVNWLRFGTSGVEKIPSDTLMIELLTHCNEYDDDDNKFVKSIVQPKHVANCHSAHIFVYQPNYYAVDIEKQPMPKKKGKGLEIYLDKIRINHYWARTENYFREFKLPRREKVHVNWYKSKMIALSLRFNRIKDTEILQYATKLRQAMGFDLKPID